METMRQTLPDAVHEYEHLVDFSLDGYIQALDLPVRDVTHTLRVTPGQFHLWRKRRVCPLAVWKRACKLWGSQGFADDRVERLTHPYRLHASYASFLAGPTPSPEPVAPPVAPPSVPWAVYEATCAMLMHQNSTLLAKLVIQDTELRRLERRCALLENGDEFRTTLTALDHVHEIPSPPAPARTEALQHLARMGGANGNGAVLSDLESRLGKEA